MEQNFIDCCFYYLYGFRDWEIFRSFRSSASNRLYIQYLYGVNYKFNFFNFRLLAIIFILCELNLQKVKRHFNFLGFFFGKAFYCLFLGMMCFDKYRWFSWACSVLFYISCAFYIALGFIFLGDEKSKFNEIKNNGTGTGTGPGPVRDVQVQQNQNKI